MRKVEDFWLTRAGQCFLHLQFRAEYELCKSSILLSEFTPLHVFLRAVEISVAMYFVGFFILFNLWGFWGVFFWFLHTHTHTHFSYYPKF